MHATYAFSPEWQAFLYADAAGFGLAGHKDMSGTAPVPARAVSTKPPSRNRRSMAGTKS